MRVSGYRHDPAALTLGNRSGVHFIEDRVGPRFGHNGCGKPSHLRYYIPGRPERSESLYYYTIPVPTST